MADSTEENAENANGNIPDSQERAVGITAFSSPKIPGFRCTMKHRYTDFLVNEISPDGEVLHLTKLGVNHSGNEQKKEEHPNQTPAKRKDRSEDDSLRADESTSPKKPRLESSEDGGQLEPIVETQEETAKARKSRLLEIESGVPEADKQQLQDIFGENVMKKVLDLYAHVVMFPDRKPREQPTVTSDVISEKPKRTAAHVAIRNIFSSKLETATMQDSPGVISIKAASPKGPSGARARPSIVEVNGAIQKGKLGWEELGGEYLHFSLYKENKDTMEVLYFIAARLKIPVKNFQFAGTKDRRAVTVQRVAIFRVHANRIAELNKMAKGWRAGDFAYNKHGLGLGDLGGNEFLLTLRDCSFEGDGSLVHEQKVQLAKRVLQHATKSISEQGFLNYYGLQRFGSFSTGTHTTGQKMLSGDLEGAADSILIYSAELLENSNNNEATKVPQDDIDRAKAIKLWQDGEAAEASRKMPKRFHGEAAIIQYLSRKDRKTGQLIQERDFQGALSAIPRNLRLMYVHAYQSFVWNTVVGKRWELFGSKVVEGDLIVVGEKDGEATAAKDDVDEDGEPIFHPAEEDSAPSTEDSFTRARSLSQEAAESGKYSIFDIVLPLPGYDVLYPANAVGRFYEEFMASETDGSIDPHNMRRSWKDISLSGAYRKLMARPSKALDFEVKSYVDDLEQMVETDLEKIRKPSTAVNGTEDKQGDDNSQSEPSKAVDPKIAIVLKLQLGSSQYATMALRELTKGGAVNYKPDYSSR